MDENGKGSTSERIPVVAGKLVANQNPFAQPEDGTDDPFLTMTPQGLPASCRSRSMLQIRTLVVWM